MVMYKQLSEAYYSVAKKLGIRVIPCGDVIQHIRTIKPFVYEEEGLSLCRDGFHIHYIYGRYLLAAVWYRFITNHSILTNSFLPYKEEYPNFCCDISLSNKIKEAIEEVVF